MLALHSMGGMVKPAAHAHVVDKVIRHAASAVSRFLRENPSAEPLKAGGLYLYQYRELRAQVWMDGQIVDLKIFQCGNEFVAVPVPASYQRICKLIGTQGGMYDRDLSPGLRTFELIRIKEGPHV